MANILRIKRELNQLSATVNSLFSRVQLDMSHGQVNLAILALQDAKSVLSLARGQINISSETRTFAEEFSKQQANYEQLQLFVKKHGEAIQKLDKYLAELPTYTITVGNRELINPSRKTLTLPEILQTISQLLQTIEQIGTPKLLQKQNWPAAIILRRKKLLNQAVDNAIKQALSPTEFGRGYSEQDRINSLARDHEAVKTALLRAQPIIISLECVGEFLNLN